MTHLKLIAAIFLLSLSTAQAEESVLVPEKIGDIPLSVTVLQTGLDYYSYHLTYEKDGIHKSGFQDFKTLEECEKNQIQEETHQITVSECELKKGRSIHDRIIHSPHVMSPKDYDEFIQKPITTIQELARNNPRIQAALADVEYYDVNIYDLHRDIHPSLSYFDGYPAVLNFQVRKIGEDIYDTLSREQLEAQLLKMADWLEGCKADPKNCPL